MSGGAPLRVINVDHAEESYDNQRAPSHRGSDLTGLAYPSPVSVNRPTTSELARFVARHIKD